MKTLIDSDTLHDYWIIDDTSLVLCCGVLVNKFSGIEKLIVFPLDKRGHQVAHIPESINDLFLSAYTNNGDEPTILPINQLIYFDYCNRGRTTRQTYIDFNESWSTAMDIYMTIKQIIPVRNIYFFISMYKKIKSILND